MEPANPRSWSSIGKKFVSGITGVGLVAFVIVHLVGNLTLLLGPGEFNAYAHFLVSMGHGAFVWVADAGLAAFFLGHLASGFSVALQRRKARPEAYYQVASKGGPSQKSFSSVTMVVTGALLVVFVAYHVWHFKFGPNVDQGYVTTSGGETYRDLYRLVIEEFKKPPVSSAYVLAMVLLGLHLRHGFWSMFQSLGANNPRFMPWLVGLGWVVAIFLAAGFLYLPLYVLFIADAPAKAALQMTGVLA